MTDEQEPALNVSETVIEPPQDQADAGLLESHGTENARGQHILSVAALAAAVAAIAMPLTKIKTVEAATEACAADGYGGFDVGDISDCTDCAVSATPQDCALIDANGGVHWGNGPSDSSRVDVTFDNPGDGGDSGGGCGGDGGGCGGCGGCGGGDDYYGE